MLESLSEEDARESFDGMSGGTLSEASSQGANAMSTFVSASLILDGGPVTVSVAALDFLRRRSLVRIECI